MSLLPAAMRLPNDISPLGKKVVPPAPPAKPDPVKEFERKAHPFPNGTYPKPPLGEKLRFGFDFGAADMTSVYITDIHRKMMDEAREAVYRQAYSAITSKPIEEKTATEMMLKQREAEQSMQQKRIAAGINKDYETPYEKMFLQQPRRAQRTPDWFDLDHEVSLASKRSGAKEVNIVRSVKSAFGGDVSKDQIKSAINYLRNLFH